jgi:site-specific DNA recombinase
VHKIDRLARNRADDVEIQLAIQRAGAQLVSVTESVDGTPSGQLLHAIMAGIAEFYSANLATEILKGSTQKALMGGTPYKAPLGYINVRQMVMGREVRTVEIDPEQAPLVRQAFELYATGDYSLRVLHKRLTAEGLATRPTSKRPAGPLALSKFANLLRNRYYLGVVPYRGVEHAGKHPALLGLELFERVQQVLDERDQHSIKTRRHQHYLRGLLNCARCGSGCST